MDFIADGQPFETPPEAAAEGYAATPPSFGNAFAAMFHDNSALEPLTRFVQRSEYQPEGYLGRALAVAGETGGEAMALPLSAREGLPGMAAQPSPMLTADEANARYAPTGPDGKPVPITSAPVPETVAQMVGKEKSDQIDRDGVLQRFADTRSLPVRFGSSMAAFLLDPMNAATAIVPGIGEEAILGQLGRAGLTGFAARTIARGGAGAIGGAAAQAPLTALKYALGSQEGDDYGLRDAMRDVALSAAGGAILQAGFGGIGDLLARRRGAPAAATAEAPGAGAPSAAATVATADPATRADAMRAAVSQIVDGREVDVEPVFAAAAPRGPARPEDINQFLASAGGLVDEGGELRAIGADKEVVPFRGRLVKEDGATLDYAREAAEEAGYLPHGSTISDLIDAIDETMRGNPRFAEGDASDVAAWREWRGARGRGPEEPFDPFDPNTMFADLADDQQRLYRDGYAAGTSQDDFDAEREAIYGEDAGDRGSPRPAMAPAPEAATDTDRAIAEAERELGATGIYPEDAAEIARGREGIEAADARAQAYQEAAGCLAGKA